MKRKWWELVTDFDIWLHNYFWWTENVPIIDEIRCNFCRWAWHEWHVHTFYEEWHDELCPACGTVWKRVEVVRERAVLLMVRDVLKAYLKTRIVDDEELVEWDGHE